MGIKKLLFCFLLLVFSSVHVLAQAPVISSFSPVVGVAGTLVTISGSGLNNATNLTIGGAAALIISHTDTQLTGFIMPGATTGSISVTTAGGTATSASNFTITTGGYSPDKQQGNDLSKKTNTGQHLQQSFSVAISADGNTALAGNPTANGEVFVFARTGTAWKQQGYLQINDGNATFKGLGISVALSADGSTAVIGGTQTDTLKGAAFVFQRINNVWTQVQPKLVGAGGAPGNAYQGRSVAISADGNTILSGGYNRDGKNAAWVFTKNGSLWQESAQLVAPSSGIAGPTRQPVALSADANTAAIGSLNGVWIFTHTSTGWVQQGDRLYGTGEQNPATTSMGSAIALSADGNTLMMGAPADNNSQGAAYIFTRNNGIWTQQGAKLVSGASGTSGQFGFALNLTADGNTAIIGMPGFSDDKGAIFVFNRTGETWTRKEMLIGGGYINEDDPLEVPYEYDDKFQQGYSTAISADGRTAIEGGYSEDYNDPAWIFIDSTVPVGSTTPITFKNTDSVTYGTANYPPAATSLNTIEPILFTSSNNAAATIINNQIHIVGAGTTLITASQATDGYYPTYSTTQTLTVTKAPLTITANDQSMFVGDAVPFLTLKYKGLVSGEDSTKLLFGVTVKTTATPASLPGTYEITPSGAIAANYDVTYVNGTLTVTHAIPTITSFSPASAIEGTIVTITGTHMDKVTSVSFGGTNALSFTASSPTTLSAVVAKGSSGDVSITAPGATVSLPGFTFVYTLPANNFTLTTTGATCNGSTNGSLKITAAKSLSYTATVTGNGLNTPYTFTTTKTISGLAAGTYAVCITVDGQPDYKQCYDVIITEPKNLSVYAEVNPNQDQLSLALGGGVNYTIKLNGVQYNTTESSINLPLSLGDNEVGVTTDKLCQGIFKKIFSIGQRIIPYPNPFQSALKLNLGNKNIGAVAVEIHDLADGRLVYMKQYANQSGILSLELDELKNHVYSLKLTRDGKENVYKIIKQQ